MSVTCVLEVVPNEYSGQVMADTRLMYRLAECNSTEARCLYADRYPDKRQLYEKIFQILHERLSDRESFRKRLSDGGRSAS